MSNRRKVSLRERLRNAGQDLDCAFFDNHPTVTSYERPATLGELRVTGYPPGTVVRCSAWVCSAYAPLCHLTNG